MVVLLRGVYQDRTQIMNKKEIRKKLTLSITETVKKLGVAKPGKKVTKLIERSAEKLAARIESALKKVPVTKASKKSVKKEGTKTKRAPKKATTGGAAE
jgi:hypothetical protein